MSRHPQSQTTAPHPLARYRSAQRALRRLFEPFTREHCPVCPTPCCRKPTWVRPVDVILVEEIGGVLPRGPAAAAVGALADAALGSGSADAGAPCDFLGPQGCAFPSDLRPFGCAAMICDPMRATLPADELAHLESAVEHLTQAHAELMAALHQPA